MRLFTAAAVVVLTCATPALADELPTRKPGLWEVRTGINNPNAPAITIQQCIDAETDPLMLSIAGPFAKEACSKQSVQKSTDGFTIDSACTFAGKAVTAHAVITGSFDSAYTMTVTSQGADAPDAKVTMTIGAKWLGACAAGQKPGDMILSNGMKINILDAMKHPPLNIPAR